ncbi:MAG: tryptophan 2,3-dioxygenase [Bacteroidetes bacterium]|nr:tryptophan 2,3-dioxygenase [Bacteroidota bacterium]
MNMDQDIIDRIKKLEEKYQVIGQDLRSYLDGLLYADFLTYWDYIHLDTLLSLQSPRTNLPDESIFILYHQITELNFKLIILTQEEIANTDKPEVQFFTERINRLNRYFESLVHSFDIMIQGMEPEQFLKFRMSLLPGSGFQSAQFRIIEMNSTELINLVAHDKKAEMGGDVEKMIDNLYWKRGATELASGKKTLTLKLFEKKYHNKFIELGNDLKNKHLWAKYKNLSSEDQADPDLISAMKQFDVHANINWPLVHYKSAVKYLDKKPEEIKATGGTNWQKYLPPKNRKIVFFPDLWSEKELADWGKKPIEEYSFIPD